MRRDSDILNDIMTIAMSIVIVLFVIVMFQWLSVIFKVLGM